MRRSAARSARMKSVSTSVMEGSVQCGGQRRRRWQRKGGVWNSQALVPATAVLPRPICRARRDRQSATSFTAALAVFSAVVANLSQCQAGECALRFQLDEVSPEILDPINWAIAGLVGLIAACAAWYFGWAILTTAFFVAVAFLGTFLWNVTVDRDDAWVSERQAELATPDALASVYAIKLRQIGINAAILGANGLFMIHSVVKADWGMLGLLAFGFAGTVAYLIRFTARGFEQRHQASLDTPCHCHECSRRHRRRERPRRCPRRTGGG